MSPAFNTMMKRNIKLIKSEDVAEGTRAFYWEKPADFSFIAGQFGGYTLINAPETDAEGNTRGFSFIVSPDENWLGFATRMRDTAFKRVLKTFKPRDEIALDAPYGDLKLHNNISRPAVFLTGGIGITPVRSIILDAAHRKLSHKIFLFYSNRRPEDAAFLDELSDIQKQNPNYKLIATMTQMDKSKLPWSGETGYVDERMLKSHLTGASNPIYYLTGPGSMVSAMRKLLNSTGVDDDDIKTEEFTGYPA